MPEESFFHSDLFKLVILPLLIFLARIIDVSLQTIRIILISKGIRLLSALLGFFEVLIWLLAIGQIMTNLSNVLCYIAYAGGFASGTWIGMIIEARLSIGKVIIRVITSRDAGALVEHLRKNNYGITTIDAEGAAGQVMIIFSIVKRQMVNEFVKIVQKFNPRAFYSIEDVRFVTGNTLSGIPTLRKSPFQFLRLLRKSK